MGSRPPHLCKCVPVIVKTSPHSIISTHAPASSCRLHRSSPEQGVGSQLTPPQAPATRRCAVRRSDGARLSHAAGERRPGFESNRGDCIGNAGRAIAVSAMIEAGRRAASSAFGSPPPPLVEYRPTAGAVGERGAWINPIDDFVQSADNSAARCWHRHPHPSMVAHPTLGRRRPRHQVPSPTSRSFLPWRALS